MAALRHLVLLVFVVFAALFVPGVASARTAGSSVMSENRAAAEHRSALGLRWGPGEIADSLLAAKGGTGVLSKYKPTQTARRFDMAKVDEYAAMMREGKWDWSADKIIVDKAGNIVSGHHRVLAAEKAGVEIPESAILRLETTTGRPVYKWSDIFGE
jgi:hypothetical protein